MFPRRSLSLPITLAIFMILMLVVLTVGWVLLALVGALADTHLAVFYWTALSVGTTLLVLVLVGVVLYLMLSIKAINLNRRQSNFIDSVTHELKSPITSLKLYLQTLNRHQVSEREHASFCRFMLEDVDRLDQLINHLLDAGRLDKGPIDGDVEEVELSELLSNCAETVCLRHRVPLRTVQCSLEKCIVRSRRVDLEMMFRNLLDNAVKYAGTEPEVEVSVQMQRDNLVVTRICDNGRGIPHSLRRKIFWRFVRLGSELERDKPGTGLGLYIVHTVVRRLRGRIRVHDREQGVGSVFEVELPGVPAVDHEPPKHIRLHEQMKIA